MSDKNIDFKQLYQKMEQAKLAQEERPAILGGEFPADRLNDFLSVWRARWSAMPYRIWEHISFIEFADEPKQPEFLQRAEIFGEGGHLSLRRDGNRWLWHYVGEAVDLPLNGFGATDFWKANPICQLRRYAESVILWGERKDNQDLWHEDRVAAANLAYPLSTNGRVYLHFWRYTENGQTAFVWYRQLSDQPPREEDKP
ncbi:type III-D CRISPR-associated protein Csx19 [Caldilinea sp.]|jgi:hypothetical protein|nr:CRISPR-associated protein Csx19 [uncultured Caldilinea sp.]